MTYHQPPAGWYPEAGSPTGIRYWDGVQWTAHVNPPPQAAPAAPPSQAAQTAPTSPAAQTSPTAQAGQAGPAAATGAAAGGGGASWESAGMLGAPTVKLEQVGKVIESSSVYAIADAQGVALGQAAQVGQGRGARFLKAASNLDRNMPVTVEFRDAGGSLVLTLHKPGGVGPQRFLVTDATGAEIGRINQRIRVVREAFELVIVGQPPGVLASENWYDYRFSVLDAQGSAYAQVQKVYEGYARARFTSADRYTVQYAPDASPVQRAMSLAAAIAMDIALYQR